jgi:hypothetical protein
MKPNVNCLTCKHVRLLEDDFVSCLKPEGANVFIDKAGKTMGKVYWPSRYVSHFVWDCDNYEKKK